MTAPSVPLYLVDAFADAPFSGNPAAVCVLERWPAAEWMQAVAAEMQQSETAFVVPAGEHFGLRWFTPAVEVDLCGHATLASAFVLWHRGQVSANEPIGFSTRSGLLKASQRDGLIELDFPIKPQAAEASPAGLLEALGVEARYVGRSSFDYLVELDSEAAVRAVRPDFKRLAEVDCRGVIVTAAASTRPFDFVSRFFAPRAGIDEDPVTGSAHCTLAHYWQVRIGKGEFTALQASRRTGVVRVGIEGERVLLGGAARLVAWGELAGVDA